MNNMLFKIYNAFLKLSHLLFVMALISFGIEIFIFRNPLSSLMTIPGSILGYRLLIYIIGTVFIVGGLFIILKIKIRLNSIVILLVLIILTLLFKLPKLINDLFNPNLWTTSFEMIALCGGCLILLGSLTQTQDKQINKKENIDTRIGSYLFLSLLIVVGIQHFMYADFISTLVPTWIPGHIYWAYFVGIAFLATAVSIILRIKIVIITSLSGLMFLLWVLILHLPRVISNIHTETEWTSLFVALAMSGISFMISETTLQNYIGKN
jgi:uncharacterized membrane protein